MVRSLLITCLFASLAFAQAEDEELTPEDLAAIDAQIAAQISPQTGDISLGQDLATLHLTDDAPFRYLDAEDARFILVDVWGNHPGIAQGVLGLIYPEGVSFLDDANSWAVVVSYENEGHVDDSDAADIDYDELLEVMQEETRQESQQRVQQNMEKIELVGWATPPRYDASSKKLYWAKELRFGDAPENTLNYNIRILGREGVLVLNAIANMSQLRDIEQVAPQVLASVEFNQGKRYSDFDPSIDKVAAAGIGGLIAGKVLAKTGLLKGLLLLLAKGWKLILLLGVGALAGFKKLFGKGDAPAATPED